MVNNVQVVIRVRPLTDTYQAGKCLVFTYDLHEIVRFDFILCFFAFRIVRK